MPQIILKERTANEVSYTFFKRDVGQHKNTSLSQLYQPPRTTFSRALIAGYFRPRNIAKFLRTRFFIEHLQNALFYRTTTQVFSCEVGKIYKNTFSYRTPPVTASALPVAASVFS